MIEQSLKKVLGFGVEDFIKKAVVGGCDFDGEYKNYGLGQPTWDFDEEKFQVNLRTLQHGIEGVMRVTTTVSLNDILLDPKAWVAVCGTELVEVDLESDGGFTSALLMENWKHKWHRFIDTLAEEV